MSGRSDRRKLDHATFSLTADTGVLSRQAALLAKSLQSTCPDANVVAFVPSESVDHLQEGVLETLRNAATVVTGDIPIDGYPISAKQQAFLEATERFDSRYYVCLDTDTVLMDTPSLPGDEADLHLRPASVGAQYWASGAASDDWQRLYEHYGLEPPEYTVQTSYDNQRIRPYFNAGVVITSDDTLAAEWLEMTEEIVHEGLTDRTETFYNDQIALALAALQRETRVLPERLNYPFGARFRCPSDVQILHYGSLENLSRVRTSILRERLRTYDWEPVELTAGDWVRAVLDATSAHSGLVLSYEQRTGLRRIVKRLLPGVSNPDGVGWG